ncbi:MAG TPA: hypothetical protein VIJ27_14485 [Mucilaginibacter sp.]
MKPKLLYLSLLLLAFAGSCLKTKHAPAASSLQGSFTGQFMFLHTPNNSTTVDTLKANIQLDMLANSSYQVTGDTSTLHAGSHGAFLIGTNNAIQFFDQTYPVSGTPTKIHLSGQYQYSYDGIVLRLNGFGPLDTVAYEYVLRKN